MSDQAADSGLILIDKPKNVTSHDVVACVRHLLHTKRVGHAGTLDPQATGLLIIGFGNATRLLNYLLGHNKSYEAVIRLGESTTTDDADGQIISCDGIEKICKIEDSSVILKELQSVVSKNFLGTIMQVPTAFSAIKINGKRAYDLAREGKEVHLEPREVVISDFSLFDPQFSTGLSGAKVLDLHANVSCSSGTYIRALARDLGQLLGVGGHLIKLRRTSIGDFSVKDARVLKLCVKTHEFKDRDGVLQHRFKAVPESNFDESKDINKYCISMIESAKYTLPLIEVDSSQAKDLRFGRWITIENSQTYPAIAYVKHEKTGDCDVVAVLQIAKNSKYKQIKPVVVFPATQKTGKLDK